MAGFDSGYAAYTFLVVFFAMDLRIGLAQPGNKTICTDISSPNATAKVLLTCEPGYSWFHVVKESYWENSTDNCQPEPSRVSTNSGSGLTVDCVGKQTNQQQNASIKCSEGVPTSLSKQFASVEYECVADSLNFNMCDDVSVERPGAVYLASPDFFDQKVSSDICRCKVMTTGLQLQALYISIDDDSSLNMTCDQCNQYNFKRPPSLTLVNSVEFYRGTNNNSVLDISFRDVKPYPRNRVWLKLNGTQNVSVTCDGNITTTESPLTSGTTIKPDDQTASPPTPPTAETSTVTSTNDPTTSTPETTSVTSASSPTSPTTDTSTLTSTNDPTTSTPETTSVTSASSPTSPTTETVTVTSTNDPATSTPETSSQGHPDNTEEGNTAPTMDANENSSFGTSTSDTVQNTVTGRSQDTHVYPIVGVVAGVFVLVCCILIVVFILRRKRQAREELEMKNVYNVSAQLEPDLSTPTGVFGPHDVCEVDLDEDPAQSGVNSHSTRTPENEVLKGTHTFTGVTPPVQSGPKKSVHTNQGPPDIAEKGTLDQPDQKVAESKNLYFILEPEYEGEDQSDGSLAAGRMTEATAPDIAEKGSFARTGQNEPESKNLYFILEPEHEDHNDKSLAAGRMQASVPDGNDYDDERCHYYSEIKDEGDAEQRIGPATAPSSSRREKGPLNAGDYEVVDLGSDNGDEEITKLKGSQGTPGRNPAADSPQSLSQTPRQDAADNTYSVIDNEEDELIMHDNVVYQSSATLEHDKDRSVMGDDDAGQREGDVERKDEDDSDDEDMVMVDNVVYQSCMDKKSDNEDTDVEER